MIKIFIVDDSEIHLEGMKSILKRSDNLTVAATAQTPNEAKQLLRNEEYDLAILDISLEEETDGLDLARFIKATYPKMPIIILSHYKDIHYIIQSLKMQLNGYLAKDTQAEDLICAIQVSYKEKGSTLAIQSLTMTSSRHSEVKKI
ncbi:response regulator transcription factor [uncultured Bacteroides sp.]|uniref:response regulator n=1 Tax=uncultured Bacteroides sp. TaxID=162156 RepID=UPI00280BE14E|nr:response regulator transcription factor [uncultured Bacteroides sp.]